MAKKLLGKNMGKFAFRLLFNVVVAAFIVSLVGKLLLDQNATVVSVVSLVILLFIVPMILQKRPGQETFLSFILAVPAGVAMLNLLIEFFPNVDFPVIDTTTSLLSPAFAFMIGAYFLADLAFISFFRGK